MQGKEITKEKAEKLLNVITGALDNEKVPGNDPYMEKMKKVLSSLRVYVKDATTPNVLPIQEATLAVDQVNFCCDLVKNLPKYFMEVDLQGKQQILGSILAEKLVFENNSYRTIPFRKVITLICRPSKGLRGAENKESSDNSELSNVVPRTGFEPAHPCERCDLNTVRLPISPPGHSDLYDFL